MAEHQSLQQSGSQRAFYVLGTIVLVLGCLYWAQKILIPLALAVLLAVVLSPLVARLQRFGLGRLVAGALVAGMAFAFLACICWFVVAQVPYLFEEIPRHRQEIAAKMRQLEGSSPSPVANLMDMARDVSAKLSPAGWDGGQDALPVTVVNGQSPVLTLGGERRRVVRGTGAVYRFRGHTGRLLPGGARRSAQPAIPRGGPEPAGSRYSCQRRGHATHQQLSDNTTAH